MAKVYIALDAVDIREQMLKLQKELEDAGIAMKNETHPHVTLRVIEDVNDRSDIDDAIEKIANCYAPFNLKTTMPSKFLRYYFYNVGGDIQRLYQMQKELDKEIIKLGYNEEPYPYHPHITIGKTRRGMTNPIKEINAKWSVNKISVLGYMHSDGLYEVEKEFELNGDL